MQGKEEILSAFKNICNDVCDFIEREPAALFEKNNGEKWSDGQTLDHLIRSVKPLNLAYRLPAFVLRMVFGKPNRKGRSYKELVDKYHAKLATGYKAAGSFVPQKISAVNKESILKNYKQQNEKLCKALIKWHDAKLDNYLLPHPLLGKLTLREMMFFTVYHNGHHLKIMHQSKLAAI